MKLDTKYFGPVEYSVTDVLSFPQGLFSFEEERQFLLLPFHGSEGTMLCLQSVKTPALAFVAMNPFALLPSYAPELRPEELEQLGCPKAKICAIMYCAPSKTRWPTAQSICVAPSPSTMRAARPFR